MSTTVIDLSIPIDESTPVYPGDPRPRRCAASTVARDGYNVLRLELGSHTGTHVDAPLHFLDDGAPIDALPLERFVGRAVIVEAADAGPRGTITRDHLAPYLDRLGPNVIVLLRTGWCRHLDDGLLFEHPHLEPGACEDLLRAGVRTIGIDAMSVDPTPTETATRADFPCHELISADGGLIVENLANLHRVDWSDPLVSVLPIRLAGADGAPVRAVAMRT